MLIYKSAAAAAAAAALAQFCRWWRAWADFFFSFFSWEESQKETPRKQNGAESPVPLPNAVWFNIQCERFLNHQKIMNNEL